jgi:hypothetical protein
MESNFWMGMAYGFSEVWIKIRQRDKRVSMTAPAI